ncbi:MULTISPECIES: DUF763 domain-containing protein [Methanothrix]|uniref:DUF763 domain-containing protein n=2 Tax=Methanothrix TaxID=2222 RepID=A0B8A2_METTP|nr:MULTISPECIES: DUF763 domain-containing protein [Methanothrix]ABK14926.1 protein of unknown function DUF763 [Methanothrix thermoacetophila PT]
MKDTPGIMAQTGTADLPLHDGRAPPWLFSRMRLLAGEIARVIIYEYGEQELLRRISDPFWFQAFSCVLGFDWHSSGTTTTTTGALRASLRPEDGVVVAGGKGATSLKTPVEIMRYGEIFSLSERKIEDLIRASRLSAKVDNALVQDGYRLYHHAFILTSNGEWAVVQQGMNERYARRYHWLSDKLYSMIEEPHAAICAQRLESRVMDLTSKESRENRQATLDLVRDGPSHIKKYTAQRSLEDFSPALRMPARHEILPVDIGRDGLRILQAAYELQPSTYEELVMLRGMGPKRVRALTLIAELIFGAPPSWRDPARYSFAHGGKDGYPYPVDRENYDRSIEHLREALQEAKLGDKEKYEAMKRLSGFVRHTR